MSQFEEDDAVASPADDADEAVPDTKFTPALTNRDVVARRRRIEDVIESKRARSYAGDYDFKLDE